MRVVFRKLLRRSSLFIASSLLFSLFFSSAFGAEPSFGSDRDLLGLKPELALHEAFTYELDGAPRRGFLDESGKDLLGVEAYAMSSAVYNPEYVGDDFPCDPVAVERRRYVDEPSALTILYERLIYSEYPCSEATVWFENQSARDSGALKDVRIFDQVLPTGGSAKLIYGYGEDPDPKKNYAMEVCELTPGETKTFTPREAYPSFGAFPYFTIEGAERSYLFAIGWTGRWTSSFEGLEDGSVRFRVGQEGVDLYLKPGEKIRTPRITVFEFPTGTDRTNLWRDWYRRYIMPREDRNVIRPKLALDVFYRGELYDLVTAEEQIDAIRKLRALGYPCEALWVDAGWYLRADPPASDIGKWFTVGDWTPDPARFPNGFRPVVDELENVPEGVAPGKLVLWFEPERVHRTALNDELRPYVVPDLELVESYRMNMASSKTVDYLSEKIGDALISNGVTIYRQDSNGAGPLPFIQKLEEIDPEYKGRKGLAENRYVEGVHEYWARLKSRVPCLIIDTCASGGRRNDLDSLRMGAVPLHYSDVGYFDFVEKQHMHDTLNSWFVYYKNIDPHDYDFEKGTYDVYKTTIDMAPFSTVRPYFLTDDKPETRNYVDRYLAIRDLLVDGDYFSLRLAKSAEDWSVWQFDDSRPSDENGHAISYAKDAVARFAPNAPTTPRDRQVGCVLCVRNDLSEEDSIVVRPKRICPELTYLWKDLETGETQRISGRVLADEGIRVELPRHGGRAFKYAVAN